MRRISGRSAWLPTRVGAVLVRYYRRQNDSGDGGATPAVNEPIHTWEVLYWTPRR